MDYKTILGIAAVVIGFVSYIPYFKDIFYGRTKPHAFSWFAWALLEGIAFFALVSKGAGAGAWVLAMTSILCLGVFLVSLSKGEKNFTLIDKLSLAGAMLGLVLWLTTKNPLTAVVLVSITDFLGFVPTFRKSYYKPHEETATMYAFSVAKMIFVLFALESHNLTTVLYPASLVLTNAVFVVMVLIRRMYLKPVS
jgi:hypothetical protein